MCLLQVVHLFSHIHQTYVVYHVTLTDEAEIDLNGSERPAKWVGREEFLKSAVSTAMKKVVLQNTALLYNQRDRYFCFI